MQPPRRLNLLDFVFKPRDAVTDQAAVGFSGANWALLLGAQPQMADMERRDLLAVNGSIASSRRRRPFPASARHRDTAARRRSRVSCARVAR
jgi:hypothetical protein